MSAYKFAPGSILKMNKITAGGDVTGRFTMLYNSTGSIIVVSYTDPNNATMSAVPIQPGYNPIAGAAILTSGSTFTTGQLYTVETVAY